MRQAAFAGARRRYGRELGEAVVERLEHELAIIARMGFSSYFLVVDKIVSQSPRTCGRGSAAASLVAYCLGITNVCPVRHNLYFGRFLNPGRSDPPDIDVDFAWDERDGVIESVLNRFTGRAAMVASHVLFQPRMALRETAKVFGMPEAEIGKVTRRLPWFWRRGELDAGLLENLRQRPETRHLDFARPWPRIMGLAQRIIGIPRYLSVHPGGVVIAPTAIDTFVPVESAPKGVPVIQWDKDGAEDAGLVKIDLLGNRSLGVIRDAIGGMRENGIDFGRNPLGARGRSRHPPYRGPWADHGLFLYRKPGHAPATSKGRQRGFRAPGDSLPPSSARRPTRTSRSTSNACTALPGTLFILF